MRGPQLAKTLKVQERHSEGPFAQRYVALETTSGNRVLLSVPRFEPAETDPVTRERALEAARRYDGLVHPHLCTQLGAGLTSSGHLWIAQELPEESSSLPSPEESSSLTPRQAAEVLTHLCEGLAYAHSRNLPHGALTRDTTLLNGHRNPRLADLGVGAALHEVGLLAERAGHAATAPETAAGQPPSPPADVYALAAMGLGLLAGGEPTAEPPSPEALADQARRLPASGLAGALERAVQRDPAARFPTAEEMLQQLRAVVAPGSPLRPARRRRAAAREESPASTAPEMTYGRALGLMAWAVARSALSLLLGLALLAAAVVGGLALAVRQTPRLVMVPSLEGKPVALATGLAEQQGLKAVVGRQAYDKTVPAGCVLAQSPYAGKTVRTGRVIELVVSLGPPQVRVPKVTGLPLSEARSLLTAAGLSLGAVSREVSSANPESVLRQTPEAGKEVPVRTLVDVTISAAPASERPSGSSEGPRAADVTVTVPQGPVIQRVKVEVHYPSGRYTVAYERTHRPGDKVTVHVVAPGEATVQTFIDGEMVAEQPLEPPAP